MIGDLISRIQDKSARIGVIGLGYVGLPVACILAKAGFHVIGVDANVERVNTIAAGQSPMGGEEPGIPELIAEITAQKQMITTTSYAELADAQVIIVCVDTPVDAITHYPAYHALRGVLTGLGPVLAPGTLVIIESTLAPGTMTGLVLPELEKASGKQAGKDFYLGHCPERVTPGLLLHNLIHVNRTVGGQTPEVSQAMIALYRHFVQADLDPADMLTAEIVKTGENAYRDVQIAFANEMAMICESLGANVYRVRELLNKSPGRAMLVPGAGVGGHCIPKDPWLLIANVDQRYRPQLIPAARAVNSQMPYHVAELIEGALHVRGVPLSGARIAVLGYAFRENTDDDRDSPSKYLVEELRRRGADPVVHDPHVPPYMGSLDAVISGAQALVVMVAHRAYRDLDLQKLYTQMACPVIIDGRNVVNAAVAQQLGFTYWGVGNRV